MNLNFLPALAGALLGKSRASGAYAPGGLFGEGLVSEAGPQYHALVKSGMVFSASALAINPTAFSGGAAGTPIFGLYNPAGSGVDLVIMQARAAIRNFGTAAANASLGFYSAAQGNTAPTGASTSPKQMYSQATTGSAALAMVNTVNTGAVASGLVAPSVGIQAVAAAAEITSQLLDDLKGAIIVPPGGYLAYGLSAALTGGSIDASLIWAEMPA